jgi:transcriptional regulator with PAS, ATPase and Fis domain
MTDVERRFEELFDDLRRGARRAVGARARESRAEREHWLRVAADMRLAADELERVVTRGDPAPPAATVDAPAPALVTPVPVVSAHAQERFAIVGASAPVVRMLALVDRLAAADVPVLVRGETGSGKEGVARRLHSKSARAKGPFVAVDCGAIPATLIESELFGHVRGAFTGAERDRPGHFVSAHGGTLLLDEIGELPVDLQPKLLRVLQDGEVRPVGGSSSRKVDVRVVAATNRDLEKACREGRFRSDLYYRLAVVEVQVPSLRERLDDLPLLVDHFVRRISSEMGREPVAVEPDALAALARHRWPGNVRELENVLRRALALSNGPLTPASFEGAFV